MSYYETAEQRQIREQRNRIERLTAELNGTSAQRDALRREERMCYAVYREKTNVCHVRFVSNSRQPTEK